MTSLQEQASRSKAGEGPTSYRRVSKIIPKPINWLWQDKIARGKITTIAGNPGLGKSQLVLSMVATVSNGGLWPVDSTKCSQGNVIILSAEDDPSDTIRPRLEASGANLDKVFILDAVRKYKEGEELLTTFNLKTDLSALESMIVEIGGAVMIVVDPVSAYLGATDSHRNSEIRGLLAPLSDLASKHDVAVICINHLNKSGGTEAMMRITGSLAFVSAARAAYLVTKEPESDRRLFLPIKNNIGNDKTGLAFSIEGTDLGAGIKTSRIIWHDDIINTSADEALFQLNDNEDRSERTEATEWLQTLLSDGPVPTKDVKSEANQAGIAWRTLRRAKDGLGIKPTKTGFDGGWEWCLPKEAKGTQQKKVDPLGEGGPLRVNPDVFEKPQNTEGAQGGHLSKTREPGHLGDIEAVTEDRHDPEYLGNDENTVDWSAGVRRLYRPADTSSGNWRVTKLSGTLEAVQQQLTTELGYPVEVRET